MRHITLHLAPDSAVIYSGVIQFYFFGTVLLECHLILINENKILFDEQCKTKPNIYNILQAGRYRYTDRQAVR